MHEVSIYRVRVKCWCKPPKGLRKKGETRRKIGNPMVYSDCLVEAIDLDHAGQLGLKFAENNATFGPKWIGFELMETARVSLPMAL